MPAHTLVQEEEEANHTASLHESVHGSSAHVSVSHIPTKRTAHVPAGKPAGEPTMAGSIRAAATAAADEPRWSLWSATESAAVEPTSQPTREYGVPAD